jgi:glycosyltransferase involved in cell wall biosynthesis
MKVLMVSPVFFPSLGGIEQHVLNLSRQLKFKGHEVDVLTTKIGCSNSHETIDSINVFRVNAGIDKQQELAFKGKKLVVPFFFEAIRLFIKKKYDLIHVHGPFALISVLPLKVFGVPVILTVHGNWINCVKGRRYYNKKICFDYGIQKCSKCMDESTLSLKLKRFLLREIAERCDAIIAVSSEVKNSIKLKKNKEIFVVPNVASTQFPSIRKPSKFPFNSKKKKILFLGSLIEEKGAKVLLEAAKNIDALLFFVYSYADKKYLKEFNAFIEKNKMNNVILFEKISNDKVRSLFIPFSDVVVIPSLWPEPCSSIATEAMSSKKPVIASRAGGFTDLIEDEVNGLLFEPGNSRELEEKIKLVFKNKTLKERIVNNALAKIESELNWNKTSAKISEIYRKVVN